METMLTKTEHTPGDWRVETWSYENGKRKILTIVTDTDAVAQVLDLWPPDAREEESKANARLLVAAPKLLAELKYARGWVQKYDYCKYGNDESEEAVARIDTLIAEVEAKT
jgi:hypothetical protein